MTKTILKTTLMAALSFTFLALSTQAVSAAELVKVETSGGKALYYNRYSAQEMQQAGCEQPVYDNMVNTYLSSRGAAHGMDTQARNEQMARQAPSASPTATGSGGGGGGVASCFSQATSQIQNVSKAASSIFNAFSGGLDTSSLMNSLTNSITQGACQEINRVTGQAVGQYTGGLLSTAGQVSGLGSTAGSALGNQIGGSMGGTVGNAVGGALNSQMTGNMNTSNLNTSGGLGGGSTAQAPSFMCTSLGIGC